MTDGDLARRLDDLEWRLDRLERRIDDVLAAYDQRIRNIAQDLADHAD